MAIGREISATVTGAAAQGEGGSFRLRPRWPQKDQLEYVQQLVTVALLLLALALVGLYAASRQVYFIGTDDRGAVSLFRGVPYELPLGIDLYTHEYSSSVPARAIRDRRQRTRLLDHKWRSREDAERRILELERAETPR